MAASAVVAASCSKNELVSRESESDGFKSLTVSAEGTEFKTAFGAKTGSVYAMVWKAGDAISVNGTVSQPLADDVAAGTPAQFKIAESVSTPYNVIYPASAVSEDGTVTIPSVQAYAAGQFDPSAAIMTGYAAGSSVTMKVACAFVKVNIARSGDEAISSLTLFANGNENISGTFDADCSTGALTFVGEASNSATMTSVAYDEVGKICAVFAVPAGAYEKGFSVLATTSEGKHMGKKAYATSGVTLQAGGMLTMPEFAFSASSVKFSGGEGTLANPYIIAKAGDLVELSSLCNSAETNSQYRTACCKQICDIDMKGVTYVPICSDYEDATSFVGSYDGGGHKIVNMSITGETGTAGLFGYVMGASIKNITMENCSVDGLSRQGVVVGSSWAGGIISNCKVINSTVHSATKDQLGAIIGYANESQVLNCEAVGCKVLADDHNSVGAICGFMKNKGVISDCSVSGCEVKAWKFGGGILGRTVGGQVRNCVVKGKTKISTIVSGAGGIGGGDDGTSDDMIIENCLVTDGTVIKSEYYSGGIAGYIYPGEGTSVKIMNCGVEDSYILTHTEDKGDGTGDCCTGGIIGWLRNSNANSKFLVLNNYCYVADKGFEVDTDAKKPSIGGTVGYISNSSTSTLEIGGNCTDIARADLVIAGKVFKEGQDLVDADKVGAIYGNCSHDKATMSIRYNYFVNDTGIPGVGHGGLNNVVVEDNEGFATSVFQDGTTVVTKLNAFASGYQGETLKTWIVKGNKPAFDFQF